VLAWPIVAEGGTARILLVEDDARLAGLSAAMLRRAGFQVEIAATGTAAANAAKLRRPDLALLDYELPDMDGLEVLELFKEGADRPQFPVLILTGARYSSGDQVVGIERGAADYLVKGLDNQVLLAHIKAKLREANARPTRLRRGRLLLDVSSGQAWLDERRLDLDRKPFLVLYHLALAEGTTLSRDELLRRVWDSGYEKFERSVDQAVYSLRQAIGEPGWVETVHGFGYRFVSHR